jgi:hypothetical protein
MTQTYPAKHLFTLAGLVAARERKSYITGLVASQDRSASTIILAGAVLRNQGLRSFRDHGCRCHEPSDRGSDSRGHGSSEVLDFAAQPLRGLLLTQTYPARHHEPRECKKVLRRIGLRHQYASQGGAASTRLPRRIAQVLHHWARGSDSRGHGSSEVLDFAAQPLRGLLLIPICRLGILRGHGCRYNEPSDVRFPLPAGQALRYVVIAEPILRSTVDNAELVLRGAEILHRWAHCSDSFMKRRRSSGMKGARFSAQKN